MKTILCLVLLALAGCTTTRPQPTPTFTPVPTAKLGVTGAKITRINAQYKFAVIDFTSRVMPAVGVKLPVYRGTERVGEVQLTVPVRVNFATADILDGDLRVGDEAR
ncbi:MAG: hypothetical protein WCS70_03790 [Verrucomicrobiota bacterium]